jgi:acetolactate synthase I/II/III large subunit
MIKLSDYVVQFIADQGVKHVFMVPGGGAMHLVDSLGSCASLQYIPVLHEQAAAIAAEAYARVTNNLGVALVTTGPGGTNAITGLAGAWLESTPCLVVSGQVKRADLKGNSGIRQRGPQELDIVEIVKSITKYAITVMDPETIRYHLEKAVYLAKSGRSGPVWLDIPLDVQAAQISPDKQKSFTANDEFFASMPPSQSPSNEVSKIYQLLNEAKRPVLLVGNGVRLAGAKEELRQLIETIDIPVLRTWSGSDLLADSHPLCFGKPGAVASRGSNYTIQNADLLLAIGARMDAAVIGFDETQFARAAKKIVVDIDLAEINKFRMNVEVFVHANAGVFIGEMLRQKHRYQPRDISNWLGRCREWKEKYPVILPEYWKSEKYVNTYTLGATLARELTGEDLIIPGSSGVCIDTFWLSFEIKEGMRSFSTGGLGAMGFGIPAAMGGCVASGGKRTVCVDGDGGFQLNIQELETVKRLNLPIKYFVINNSGYASIRGMQRNHFNGRLVACDASSGMTLPNVLKQAEAYGIAAVRLEKQEGLAEKLSEILAMPGPVVCEVMVDPDQAVGPRVSSVVKTGGQIVSRPLEDLWPFLNREEFYSNMIVPPLPD